MDSFFRQSISKNAGQAAALERRDGGNGYAYALGLLRGILGDRETTPAEKVERGRFLIDEFDRRLKGGYQDAVHTAGTGRDGGGGR